MQLDLSVLPGLNALLNSISAVLIVGGITAIKRRNRMVHQRLMIAAAVTSTLFLISYVIKATFLGTTVYGGVGADRVVYLAVLFSHLILAMAVVPLVAATVTLAWRRRFDRHRRIARWTYPIWLYVSVTGVAVYWMLRPYY